MSRFLIVMGPASGKRVLTENSGRQSTTGASRAIFLSSTRRMMAVVVKSLPTEPTQKIVSGVTGTRASRFEYPKPCSHTAS
jgi:hypothetical protein